MEARHQQSRGGVDPTRADLGAKTGTVGTEGTAGTAGTATGGAAHESTHQSAAETVGHAREAIGHKLHTAKETISEKLHSAKETISHTLGMGKDKDKTHHHHHDTTTGGGTMGDKYHQGREQQAMHERGYGEGGTVGERGEHMPASSSYRTTGEHMPSTSTFRTGEHHHEVGKGGGMMGEGESLSQKMSNIKESVKESYEQGKAHQAAYERGIGEGVGGGVQYGTTSSSYMGGERAPTDAEIREARESALRKVAEANATTRF